MNGHSGLLTKTVEQRQVGGDAGIDKADVFGRHVI